MACYKNSVVRVNITNYGKGLTIVLYWDMVFIKEKDVLLVKKPFFDNLIFREVTS